MMIKSIRRYLANVDVNLKGLKTNRKMIVFESDDWGAIRMPSTKTYNKLLMKGIAVNRSPYCKYDTLANEEDLYSLFEVLRQFKDVNGNYPVVTANTVTCNPDFDRIKEAQFNSYFYEDFTETLDKYYPNRDVFRAWNEGIDEKVFYPQFHGREHVNVNLWLHMLKNKNRPFMDAFHESCWGLSRDVLPDMRRSIQASFDYFDKEELDFQKKAIKEGLKVFKDIFGYKSESFIANNFIWDSELEPCLHESGVKYIQGMKYQKMPIGHSEKRELIRHWTGENNRLNQIYLIRNCSFEPSLSNKGDSEIKKCLNQIAMAFRFKKPAIITSHRLNYIGGLNRENRDKNLKRLQLLLTEVLKQWEDVEFSTSPKIFSECNDQKNTG